MKRFWNWLITAMSNGGGILVLAAILLSGAVGEYVQPISFLNSGSNPGVAREPVLNSPAVIISDYKCPDNTWVFKQGFNADVGSAFQTCTKNEVVIRHFDRVTTGVNPEQAMDQGVYPFKELSIPDAIKTANSR